MVAQTNPEPRRLRAGRVEGQPEPDAERRAALRPAVPRDDRHRHATTSRRALGFAWSPFDVAAHGRARQRRPVLRPRAAARAWPTRCCRPATRPTSRNLRQISVSLSPTQAGAPVFPNILSGAVPSVTLVNLTTMDRELQNAYSRQASVEVEQQLGRAQHRQRRLSVPARR